MVSKAALRAAIALPAANAHMQFYNPSNVMAHVQLREVDGTTLRNSTVLVSPGHMAVASVAKSAAGPRVVLMSSDVPVAAAPLS